MQEQDYGEWLSALKAGDQVIVQRGVYDSRVSNVTRVLPSQVVVGNIRFNVLTGRERGGDSWSRAALLQPTPRLVAKIEHRDAAQFLRAVNWDRLSPELLKTIRDMVEGARESARAEAAVDPVSRVTADRPRARRDL